MAPSIVEFEKRLREKVALTHYKAFPASLITDDKGNIIMPEIEERRIHMGFHNGHNFIGSTVLTNAVPELDDKGKGSELVFHGQVEMPKYMPKEYGVALVFAIEYKFRLTVLAPLEKKTGLSAFVESLSPKSAGPPLEKTFVEKVVSLGWSSWNICDYFVGMSQIN